MPRSITISCHQIWISHIRVRGEPQFVWLRDPPAHIRDALPMARVHAHPYQAASVPMSISIMEVSFV